MTRSKLLDAWLDAESKKLDEVELKEKKNLIAGGKK